MEYPLFSRNTSQSILSSENYWYQAFLWKINLYTIWLNFDIDWYPFNNVFTWWIMFFNLVFLLINKEMLIRWTETGKMLIQKSELWQKHVFWYQLFMLLSFYPIYFELLMPYMVHRNFFKEKISCFFWNRFFRKASRCILNIYF